MRETNDDAEITDRRLCATCVGEAFLRSEVERLGETGQCDYCGATASALSIGEIVDYIDTAFEQHYRRTPTEPSSFEYAMMKYGDYRWTRGGEPAVYAIAYAAEIDDEPADDIMQVLKERHYDIEMQEMGEEPPFDEESCYTEKEPDDVEYRENWRHFESNLKASARFFSADTEAILEDIFEGLAEHRSPDGQPIILEAGPETAITSLYRARVFQATPALEEALKRPDRHMGPPPTALAKPGRMNAHGIAVFYGATDPAVATSEVRPPVGSRVIVGEFALLRNVSLLDVKALRSVLVEGSVFDSGYIRRLERAKFLERLSERISRPVMPEDEPLEYLVTQIVADYLASLSMPALDGILYPSVQDGTNGSNVMLFHKASRVALVDLSEGTEIDVQLGHHTEDAWETDYTVWEKAPPPKQDQEEKADDILSFRTILSRSSALTEDYDERQITLRLKLEGLSVHHVTAARYDADVHPVRHYRPEPHDPPF